MNGTQIGSYVVLGELARGGMASVFAARHLRLGHLVAIKILHPQYQKNAEVATRFLEEARIQANLRHPNILTVQDILELSDWSGMVMELLDGATLSGYYRKVGLPLDNARALGIFLPLVDALVYAHECEVVHRDLKPANIFLHCGKQEVIPKLMDFGIAKVRNTAMQTNLTAAGAVLGTPQYMAPEQFEDSSKVDYRADIYAMGVMLYEVLTGKLPFSGTTPGAIMKEVLLSPLVPPSQIVPGVDAELEAVVMKCLNRDREKRYASVLELYKALDALTPRLGRKVPAVTEVERVDLRAKGIDVPSSRSTANEERTTSALAGAASAHLVTATPALTPLPDAKPTVAESAAAKAPARGHLSLDTVPPGTDWKPTVSGTTPAPKRGWIGWVVGVVVVVVVGVVAVAALSNGDKEESAAAPASAPAKSAAESPAEKPKETPPNVQKEAGADVKVAVQVRPEEVKPERIETPPVTPPVPEPPKVEKTLAELPVVPGLMLGKACPPGDSGVRSEAERAIYGLLQAGWRGQTLAMMGGAAWKELGLVDGDLPRAQSLRNKTGDPTGDALAAWLEEAAKPFLAKPLELEQLSALAARLTDLQWGAFVDAKAQLLCRSASKAGLSEKEQEALFETILSEYKLTREQFTAKNNDPLFDPLTRAEVATRAICCLLASGKIR